MSIFIGGAWPYANGSLHLGRVASMIPGDVIARYFRIKGEEVLYVSGSDCHGTPISIQANKEGISPKMIADRYHNEFIDCFRKIGFSYDLYTRTDAPFHHEVVQELFNQLIDSGALYKKAVEQTYCNACERFLPDRYVEGNCPHCGSVARGDQCDTCSTLLDPLELHQRKCKLCNETPSCRFSDHYFLALSKFQNELEFFVEKSTGWRENAIRLTKRYLEEGLQDRAATRDLDWGVDVPLAGFEGKKIYVWVEAVSGYLSASKQWAKQSGESWEKFWIKEGVKAYYIHGKDNVPFHTLIWPAILLGIGNLHLPDQIVSGEFLTLEGRKFSTSRNWAVWVPYILDRYEPDSVRYFLIANGPENRDTDFSWREFIYSHNGELLGAYGNFVNRSLVFIEKFFDGRVPNGVMEIQIKLQIEELYTICGSLIEKGRLKEALETVFAFIRSCNKYFDEQKPWIQIKEDAEFCGSILYTCVQIIANLSTLLEPFVPFSCKKIRSFLSLDEPAWGYFESQASIELTQVEVLFQRIDVSQIEYEIKRLTAIEK
ncbi:methionine--tRNA ligase [Paenibacillus sedimenti]|uniref:Methionine--tRNA ligase n=1 Tax=Paenibacillus sedimenti TaxID=2770274 RepID=A0A926QJ15_9BACL|nr:methionine--tRNA ligase [Paenibacillus sedimenti]MBD0379917.1 methionine--tRNA ligase [Paenibacillus sedimenti]